jgi:hypothetical protein
MHFMKITGVVAALTLAACASTTKQSTANDSLIGNLSNSQRKPIDEARTQHDQRNDQLAVARQDVVRAKAECSVAKKDLDLADARVEKAQAVVAVAETGTASDLEQAREALRVAQAARVPQHDLIHWRECGITHAEKAELLAQREEQLAQARVELAKAKAFVQADQAASRNVDVAKHEADVSEAQKQAALAKVEVDAAARDCDTAQHAYDAAKTASKKD